MMGPTVLIRLLIMVCYLLGVILCGNEPIEEEAETSWYQIPSIGIYKPTIDEDTGKSIRSRFKDPEQESIQESVIRKSPSLELTFSETGDNTFLDKKTIKHSMTDLSSLTKAKKVLGDVMLSCNAVSEGPKMYFPTCPGDIVVITIAGSMKMTCNEIEKRVFYGPVTIKSLSCQQSFVFDMACEKKMALRITDSSCDQSLYKTMFILVTTLFGVAVILLVVILLWIIGMTRGVDVNGKKASLIRKGCYYELYYNEFINGDGVKAYSLKGDPSSVNMQKKILRKHWTTLLLTFLLCRPIKIAGFELLETYDSTILKYNYKMILGDSENIKFGSDSLRREAVVHTSTLTRMFTTAKWDLNTKEEFFCQWYKCEAVSVCGIGPLPFVRVGALAQELFKFENQNHSYYTCQKLQGYCMFGNGCKLIAFEVILDNTEVYSVYSIGMGGSHGGQIKSPIGCVIDNIDDKSSGILDDHLLLSGSHGKNFLCHRDLFSAKPELGMLGDLQVTEDGVLHFASNEVRCVADHGDRAICRYSSPFISSLETLCENVDNSYLKISVDIPNRIISWRQSGEAIVSMKCDRKLPLKSSTGSCVDIELKVWEVAHLDSHLLLSFKAHSTSGSGVYKFPSLVHMNGHSFLCNGEPQFTELYDLKSLRSIGVNFTMDSIPFSSLDPIQEDHFSDYDPDYSRGVTVIDSILSSTPFWGLSSTTILILLLILFLCLRK